METVYFCTVEKKKNSVFCTLTQEQKAMAKEQMSCCAPHAYSGGASRGRDAATEPAGGAVTNGLPEEQCRPGANAESGEGGHRRTD